VTEVEEEVMTVEEAVGATMEEEVAMKEDPTKEEWKEC